MRRLLLFLPLLGLLCGCDEKQVTPPPPPAQQQHTELVDTPDFNGHNAYTHCAAICSLGPRYSGSAAYEKQLLYLEKHLHAAGWQTARDAFTAPKG